METFHVPDHHGCVGERFSRLVRHEQYQHDGMHVSIAWQMAYYRAMSVA